MGSGSRCTWFLDYEGLGSGIHNGGVNANLDTPDGEFRVLDVTAK